MEIKEKLIDFVEMGGIRNMHHSLRGVEAPEFIHSFISRIYKVPLQTETAMKNRENLSSWQEAGILLTLLGWLISQHLTASYEQ